MMLHKKIRGRWHAAKRKILFYCIDFMDRSQALDFISKLSDF